MQNSQQRGPLTPEQEFALLVKERREALGWSQEELARQVSEATGATYHQTAITRIELGTRNIRLNEVVTLARVLSIELGPLARNLTDGYQEDYIRRALDSATGVKAEAEATAFHIQEEMEILTNRYAAAVSRIAGAEETIRHLENVLAAMAQKRSRIESGARAEPDEVEQEKWNRYPQSEARSDG